MTMLEQASDWYLDKFHWTKQRAENQYQWYRCQGCMGLVTWKHIKRDGGCKCGSARISPTVPRLGEKFQLLLLPWTV